MTLVALPATEFGLALVDYVASVQTILAELPASDEPCLLGEGHGLE
jgi:hypothetical protein